MTTRRSFSTLLGSAAIAWPMATRAQQLKRPVVGYLYTGVPEKKRIGAFLKGLAETGFSDGRDVSVDFRFAYNHNERLKLLAAELVRERVSVIATVGSVSATLAAKELTTSIPIVFMIGGDPVELRIVDSLSRPSKNVTGISAFFGTTSKRLGLLRELLPNATHFAALIDAGSPAAASLTDQLHAAAKELGSRIDFLTVHTQEDIEARMMSLEVEKPPLIVGTGPLLFNRRVQLATLAARYAIPAIYTQREFSEVGGLMSYGPNNLDQSRLAGVYVGRILKGERPSDLPVLRATKFEFLINLQTARALGLPIPSTLLARADEVIE